MIDLETPLRHPQSKRRGVQEATAWSRYLLADTELLVGPPTTAPSQYAIEAWSRRELIKVIKSSFVFLQSRWGSAEIFQSGL